MSYSSIGAVILTTTSAICLQSVVPENKQKYGQLKLPVLCDPQKVCERKNNLIQPPE
jgi:hypothetical protein